MKRYPCVGYLVAAGLLWAGSSLAQTITVSFPVSRSDKPLDGRVLLLVSNDPKASTDPEAEPRMQIDNTLKSQMVFGITVDAWKPGKTLVIGENARGYPRARLREIPSGDYPSASP